MKLRGFYQREDAKARSLRLRLRSRFLVVGFWLLVDGNAEYDRIRLLRRAAKRPSVCEFAETTRYSHREGDASSRGARFGSRAVSDGLDRRFGEFPILRQAAKCPSVRVPRRERLSRRRHFAGTSPRRCGRRVRGERRFLIQSPTQETNNQKPQTNNRSEAPPLFSSRIQNRIGAMAYNTLVSWQRRDTLRDRAGTRSPR